MYDTFQQHNVQMTFLSNMTLLVSINGMAPKTSSTRVECRSSTALTVTAVACDKLTRLCVSQNCVMQESQTHSFYILRETIKAVQKS